MTQDQYPKWWLRMVKIYLLWKDLPESEADRLFDILPEVDQDTLNALVLVMKKTPQKVLRDLEQCTKKYGLDFAYALIKRLPRVELEKLVKAGLKHNKLIENVSKTDVEELRELVQLLSLPKNFLAYMLFYDGLDKRRKKFLLRE